MKILVKEDGDGFLARVRGSQNLFAFGTTQKRALNELSNIIDMMMDFHLEQIEQERHAKQALLNERGAYGV